MRVTVVVLGDLGLCPRMQYHAEALAVNEIDVDIVACAGSSAMASVRHHPRITCHLLAASPARRKTRVLYLLTAAFRALRQAVWLTRVVLFKVPRPDVILAQNPPAIPTLLVVLLAARFRSARLIIDWHNFAWTVLAGALRKEHPVVAFARWYERVVGARADAHFCVSKAMRTVLREQWQFDPVNVLYDRPTARFQPFDKLLRQLRKQQVLQQLGGSTDAVLLICPSSWTRDDDFGLLIDAVNRLEAHAETSSLPPIVVLLTGNGGLRPMWQERFRALSQQSVLLKLQWLEADDYPAVLASADMGLCLHRSTSGVDLPMKIVDMVGAGLPVIALDYGPCLTELVRQRSTGLLFKDANGLAHCVIELFHDYPAENPLRQQLYSGVLNARQPSWSENWREHALPMIVGSMTS